MDRVPRSTSAAENGLPKRLDQHGHYNRGVNPSTPTMAADLDPSYGERMARTDFRTPRLYVSQDLATGAEVRLDPQQTNYLVNVLRLGAGAPVLLFNGRDGEFSARLATSSRKAASLIVGARTRAQEAPPDIDYLFAPLK